MTTATDALGDAVHAVLTAGGRSSSAYAKTLERNKAAAQMATFRYLDAAIVAEDTNVIVINFQLKDLADNNVAAVVTAVAEILDANAELEAVANFHLGEASSQEVSTTNRPSLVFQTDAAGVASLEVTDVNGASGATKKIRVKVFSDGTFVGVETLETVTFD